MPVELPCVVWVDIAPGTKHGPDAKYGLLIEWRQQRNKRGNTYWEGFVVMGQPPTEIQGAEVTATWYRSAYLTLVDVPRPPKREEMQ